MGYFVTEFGPEVDGYNLIMSRWLAALLFAAALGIAAEQQEQAPPEEDESLSVKEYSFNPLQATKEVQVGNYYFKKGSFRAAAQRFREATKWNPGLAEAWLRLAETDEKQKDRKSAREAYQKYLELAPDAKNADDIRKRISKMKH